MAHFHENSPEFIGRFCMQLLRGYSSAQGSPRQLEQVLFFKELIWVKEEGDVLVKKKKKKSITFAFLKVKVCKAAKAWEEKGIVFLNTQMGD